MSQPLRIALIPAYEPESVLLDLLAQLRISGFETVVVNDGSNSAFDDIFTRAAEFATVLVHPQNEGKGRAIKTGLEFIAAHYDTDYTAVTLDEDGQHKLEDAVRVCEAAQLHPDTLVLGSRSLKDKVPLRSQFGNTITRCVYSLSTGLHVHDTQTGLRAFGKSLLPRLLQIPGERYEYEMNALLTLAREKIPILEVEISTIYIDNNSGSHFDTVKDSYRIYKEILRFSGSSLISFFVDYGFYSLFSVLTAGMGAAGLTASNIAARIISASVNYTINRKFVFKSRKGIAKSAGQYFLLAAGILLGNTLMLNLLVETLGLNRYSAKLLTELVFFLFSWTIQRFFIFQGKEQKR